METIKRFFWHWLPPLAWMGLIFFLSAQPDLPHAPDPWIDTLIKKIGHALVFGLLAWLYLRALRERFPSATMLRWASAGLAFLYAASDEYHQMFVLGRKGRLFDVGIDTVGICCAMLLDGWWARRRLCRLVQDRPIE
jgi:VanZ family protein